MVRSCAVRPRVPLAFGLGPLGGDFDENALEEGLEVGDGELGVADRFLLKLGVPPIGHRGL